MRRLCLAAVLLAGPACAQVSVEACQPRRNPLLEVATFDLFECDLRNDGEVAVAEVSYSVTFTEEGREVPWGERAPGGAYGTPKASIPGGIEPGETVSVGMQGQYLPARADPARVTINLTILGAFNVNGEPIP